METKTNSSLLAGWVSWAQPPRNMAVFVQKRTCLSQYAFMSLLSAVCLLILNCTTEPSWPATFRLMWSFSVFTPSCNKQQTAFGQPAITRTNAESRGGGGVGYLGCRIKRHRFSCFYILSASADAFRATGKRERRYPQIGRKYRTTTTTTLS